MRRALIGLLGLVPALALGADHSPPAWSPDNGWLAVTVTSGDRPATLAPGWLFETAPGERARPGNAEASGGRDASTYRIYAAGLAEEGTVLIEESRSTLSAPSWRPDGRALAYERLVEDDGDLPRVEVVLREGLQSRRTLATLPALGAVPRLESRSRLPGTAPAWSPDGRYLAVPTAGRAGFAVIRVDTGRVMKAVDDGVWPVWSPDGGRIAYVRVGGADALAVLEPGWGPSRQIGDLGRCALPPAWSRDGAWVLAVARRDSPRMSGPSRAVLLARFQVETGHEELVAHLGVDMLNRTPAMAGVAYTLSRDGDELFFVNDVPGQPTAIVWYRPRTGETFNRFHPLDTSLRLGALRLSPGGKALALRLGRPGTDAPTAVWEVGTGRLVPIVPDDPARVEWVALLVRTARDLIRAGLPAATAQGRPVPRPTALPIPGEIPTSQEFAYRLRRIGKLGRPLCDRPADAPPAEPEVEAFLRDARLFFDVLREDYRAALNSLEAVEARTESPDRRLRLLSLRAQVYAGLGEFERARDVADFLQADERRQRSRIEDTPGGPVLTPEAGAASGWPTYLAQRVQERARSQAGRAGDEEPIGHRNDDPAANPVLIAPFDRPPDGGGFPLRGIRGPGLDAPPGPAPPPPPGPPLLPRFQRRENPR
jgi:Tol biopolymer transport system component